MVLCLFLIVFFFFFNDTATTEIYTLSLHDALPIPWLLSSAGYAVWLDTAGAGVEFELGHEWMGTSVRSSSGSLRLNLITDPTPAAQLRHYCGLTGFPPVLPEWGYGYWKSRDVYEHQRDVEEDFDGYNEHSI